MQPGPFFCDRGMLFLLPRNTFCLWGFGFLKTNFRSPAAASRANVPAGFHSPAAVISSRVARSFPNKARSYPHLEASFWARGRKPFQANGAARWPVAGQPVGHRSWWGGAAAGQKRFFFGQQVPHRNPCLLAKSCQISLKRFMILELF